MKSLVDMTDLESAAVLSLSSEKRLKGKAGYWADALDGGNFGSHLWTLSRSTLSEETLHLAEQYAMDSLQWMVEKGLVEDVKVSGRIGRDRLMLDIELDKRVEIQYAI